MGKTPPETQIQKQERLNLEGREVIKDLNIARRMLHDSFDEELKKIQIEREQLVMVYDSVIHTIARLAQVSDNIANNMKLLENHGHEFTKIVIEKTIHEIISDIGDVQLQEIVLKEYGSRLTEMRDMLIQATVDHLTDAGLVTAMASVATARAKKKPRVAVVRND